MNFTPTYGWYYLTADDKAPAWTGVPYFYNFLTRKEQSAGPFAVESQQDFVMPGDFVQLLLEKEEYAHTPVIVEIGTPATLENILVAAHSVDADYRPLSTYPFRKLRFLHVEGAFVPQGKL